MAPMRATPLRITRRDPGPEDVLIEIAYCGICHSDLHQVLAGYVQSKSMRLTSGCSKAMSNTVS